MDPYYIFCHCRKTGSGHCDNQFPNEGTTLMVQRKSCSLIDTCVLVSQTDQNRILMRGNSTRGRLLVRRAIHKGAVVCVYTVCVTVCIFQVIAAKKMLRKIISF